MKTLSGNLPSELGSVFSVISSIAADVTTLNARCTRLLCTPSSAAMLRMLLPSSLSRLICSRNACLSISKPHHSSASHSTRWQRDGARQTETGQLHPHFPVGQIVQVRPWRPYAPKRDILRRSHKAAWMAVPKGLGFSPLLHRGAFPHYGIAVSLLRYRHARAGVGRRSNNQDSIHRKAHDTTEEEWVRWGSRFIRTYRDYPP